MADPDSYVGDYEFQVPIFVVTHNPPAVQPKQDEHLTFTFMTEGVESAIEQAKAAASDKLVRMVGGASLIQELLGAGLVDELRVDIMPVLLGDGLRLLENLDPERLRLEKLDVREVGARTSLGFRILTR
jgi:dihydrofolate reductase